MNPHILSRSFAAGMIVFFGSLLVSQAQKNPAFAPVTDDPDLPRVLLIGDSISIGYTIPVQRLLDGKANVHRVPSNAGNSGRSLENLDTWLEKLGGEWDLIHCNWGLWDLTYRNPDSPNQGNRDKVNGTVMHPVEEYGENLDRLILQLRETGAQLIFATTTPVPEGELGRKLGSDVVYNDMARKVMEKHNVAINDLHAVMKGKMDVYGKAPGDVHFTEEGSQVLADQVASTLLATLEERKTSTLQLFGKDGDLNHLDMDEEGGWVIAEDGSLTCLMKEVTTKKGERKLAARGDIWTTKSFSDFDLTLEYKLSEGANSGVFYRTDRTNKVQGGFEVQLMDNEGFQKTHGKKDDRKLNASFYDGQAPSHDAANPVGEWNHLRLTCQGPHIRIALNGEKVVAVNVDEWKDPGMNPDGTTNKFKIALAELPRTGLIGFQNHGQQIWFRDVEVIDLGR